MDGVAAPVVEHYRPHMMRGTRRFYKMSGSGNDFVFFDSADGPVESLESPGVIRSLSARGTGVGADGVVFLSSSDPRSIAIRYYNSDGSPGELCGNATLCALRFAHDRGMVEPGEIAISTVSGLIPARIVGGQPEIDLAPVTEVVREFEAIPRLAREARLGFARAGVPHVVILDADTGTADVLGRGSEIRRDRSLRDGANVNFVSPGGNGWLIRTYERGVEGETLACGTGAVAAGILLTEWGRAETPVRLETRSGRSLEVRVRRSEVAWHPSLRGDAELVFSGEVEESVLRGS